MLNLKKNDLRLSRREMPYPLGHMDFQLKRLLYPRRDLNPQSFPVVKALTGPVTMNIY